VVEEIFPLSFSGGPFGGNDDEKVFTGFLDESKGETLFKVFLIRNIYI